MTLKAKILVAADGVRTLEQACTDLLNDLEDVGASGAQKDAMRVAFYLGAAQVFSTIDRAGCINEDELVKVMARLFREIDTVMCNGQVGESVGHA